MQGTVSIVHENIESGRIQQIDFCVVPFQCCNRSIDGDFSLYFFFIKIRERISFIHLCQAVCHSSCIEQCCCQLSFPGMTMPCQGHIAYILTVVDSHRFLPRLKFDVRFQMVEILSQSKIKRTPTCLRLSPVCVLNFLTF